MNNNFREAIQMPTLKKSLGVTDMNPLNAKQKKAVHNMKCCSNDKWAFVNSWIDNEDEDARNYLLDADMVFSTIYKDSLDTMYDDGFCAFNSAAKSYLKDIRFCGKHFLQTVALYFTAKLLEEVMPEIEATDAEVEHVKETLVSIRSRIVA